MPRSIEQHVDWINNLIGHMIHAGHAEVEAEESAKKWTEKHVADVANQTLFAKGKSLLVSWGKHTRKAKSVHTQMVWIITENIVTK